MMRWIGAAGTLSCIALGACQFDSRELSVLDPNLLAAGEGSAGGLRVQPSSIAYGPVALGFPASARLLLENTGATTLAAPAVSLEGDAAGAFILTRNDCTTALEAGGDCELAVAFRPSDVSAREATLRVAGSGRSVAIPLSGSGLVPGGLLLQAASGSGAPFGDVPLQGEQQATLQLRNATDTSSGPVELISNNLAFQLLPAQGSECAPLGTQLAGGQSCSFRVLFAPALRGVTDGTITARSPGAGSVSLGVSGRALAPARLVIDQTRLDFGDVVVAGAAVLDLTLSNGGDQPLPPVGLNVQDEAIPAFRASENGCSVPLPAREACNISVSFSPGAVGPHAAMLNIDAGSAGLFGVNLVGSGLPAGNLAIVAVDGSDGDFGPVVLGGESRSSLRVSNTSLEASGPITLAVNSADFTIEAAIGAECASGVTNLSGGASCDLRVRFAPTERQQRNATLVVSSAVGAAVLNLSGVGLAPADFRADGAVDFGATSEGSMTTRNVTVTNPGDELLAPLSARVSGADVASFIVQRNDCAQGVQPRASCLIAMGFAPTKTGLHGATLTLQGVQGAAHAVTLSGTGVTGGLFGVQPTSIFFDTPVEVGQTARAGLTVSNRGSTATGVIAASIATTTPGFSVSPGTCIAALASGESCELDVVFAPTTSGPHSGSVRVTSTPGGSLEVPVGGTGNVPAALTVIAPEGSDFGDVGVGASATLSFTLRNIGDLRAGTLLGIALGSGFSLAPSAAAECIPNVTLLDGNGSCPFRVLFQPTTTGNFAASMDVTTESGASTSVFLSGAGVAPPALSGAPPTLAFFQPVDLEGQGSETLRWTIRNTGGSPTQPVVLTNSNDGEFYVVSHTCFGPLAPDAECIAQLQLAPDAVGERMAIITATAGSLSVSVSVTGTGYDARAPIGP